MMAKAYKVYLAWDPDALRWWARSDEIPGLATEAETYDGCVNNVLALVPELAALNALGDGRDLPIDLISERRETVRLTS